MSQWWEKQIGPLPAGMWIAVIGGGMGLAVLVNRATKSAAADDAALVPADMVTPTGPVGLAPPGIDPAPATGPSNNTEWMQRAVVALTSKGYEPYAVDQALSRYLEAQQLNAAERGMVDAAIRAVGYPPDPPGSAPPAPVPRPHSPKPKPKPKPKPPTAPKPTAHSGKFPPAPAVSERIVGKVGRPGHPGSGWYLGERGGVFAVGGAPFFGSYFTIAAKDRNNDRRRFYKITATGVDGYTISAHENIPGHADTHYHFNRATAPGAYSANA